MTRLALTLVLASGFACAHRGESIPVKEGVTADRGRALTVDSFCGGMALTEDEERALEHPLSRVRFVVLPGDENSSKPPVAEFTTDSDGEFEVPKLSDGTYCVVRKDRQLTVEQENEIRAPLPPSPEKVQWDGRDRECLRRLPLVCDAEWVIDPRGFRADIRIQGTGCPGNEPCVERRAPDPR